MNKRCKHIEEDGFHRCGSYAFNLEKDDIDQGDLCDVHYWKNKAKRTWVDLTRTQIQNVYFEILKEHRGGHQMQGQLAFGEALQAKIKEKNSV